MWVQGVVAVVVLGGVVGEGAGTGVLLAGVLFEGLSALVAVGEGSVGVAWLPHATKKKRAVRESIRMLRFNFRCYRQRYRMTGWILLLAPG